MICLKKTLLLTAVLCMLLCSAGMAEPVANLLINPSFEELDSAGMPVGWYTDAYLRTEGYTVFGLSPDAYDGEHCATVHNIGENDARFAQTVRVEPDSLYLLSGWIRSEIPEDDLGWGANLSVEGVYASSESVYDTDDAWVYVELYGETGPDQREVNVFARLGGYSGESVGRAAFDQLTLVKVDALPDEVMAAQWYREPMNHQGAAHSGGDASDPQAPAWAWLVGVSILWLALGILLLSWLCAERSPQMPLTDTRSLRAPPVLWVGLALALAVRYFIAARVEGYQVDVNCFLSWGATMAKVGPAGYYAATSFCDYPPAYLYVLGVCAHLASWLQGISGGVLNTAQVLMVYKTVPMLCDIAMAWTIWRTAVKLGVPRDKAAALACMLALMPVIILNSAAWCQIDSVLALLLLWVAVLAMEGRWRMLMPVYVLAILVKPQALMLGFLGLTALILEARRDRAALKEMLIGAGIALGMAAVLLLPFYARQAPGWLISKYGETLSSYPYATVNTANLYYLFGDNWRPIGDVASPGACVCLALFSAAWGLWNALSLRRAHRRLWWLEGAMMAVYALYFIAAPVFSSNYQAVGYVAMSMAFAVTLPLYIRGGRTAHLPLLGGLLFLLLYALGIRMHERYLFPALPLLMLAFVCRRDWRTLLALMMVSAAMFVNVGIPLDNSIRLGSSMGHLNADTHGLAMGLSVLTIVSLFPLLWSAMRACYEAEALQPSEAAAADDSSQKKADAGSQQLKLALSSSTDHRLHWRRIDTLMVLGITAVYSVAALWHLGSFTAPQKAWTSTHPDEYVVLDLGQVHEDFSMLYYCGVSYRDFTVQTSDDGVNWSAPYWAEMNQAQCYRWKYLGASYEQNGSRIFVDPTRYDMTMRLHGRYVRIQAQQIGLILEEVIFRETAREAYQTEAQDGSTVTQYRDVSGRRIDATVAEQGNANEDSPLWSSASALLDEQETLVGEPGWYTGTYFDEIYHARTAYEHLHGQTPYETSHPPLGKVLMSWGVAIFGMTPFGWRFAGALAGILMLPAMYVLSKQLTKRTLLATLAAVTLALDCMHYTQTRIATIDSFPVLFIMLSYLFMLRFMQWDLGKSFDALSLRLQGSLQTVKRVLPDLALSGFFMGCAVASKWIGVYAGIGLAVLFGWTCVRHLRLARCAREALRSECALDEQQRFQLETRGGYTFQRVLMICLWCLLFFVAVPLLIYLLSYLPYYVYRKPASLAEYLKLVYGAQEGMLSYHSTPCLGMDHPFYSPWYEWPVNGKPMYYAIAQFMPQGVSQAIFCFGNPAVWYVGLGCLCLTLILWAHRHFYLDAQGVWAHVYAKDTDISTAFVLLGFLAQYLPWVLVPRGTYIYHYFASVPFLILAVCVVLERVGRRFPRICRTVCMLYMALCLAYFILLFPYASGLPVPLSWLDFAQSFTQLHLYHS